MNANFQPTSTPNFVLTYIVPTLICLYTLAQFLAVFTRSQLNRKNWIGLHFKGQKILEWIYEINWPLACSIHWESKCILIPLINSPDLSLNFSITYLCIFKFQIFIPLWSFWSSKDPKKKINFIYSEKATKFEEISYSFIIITGVRPEDEQALASESRAVNPVIHLIFARCCAIVVCWLLGK